MKIYNTLTKSIEEFVPIDEEVRIYTCGPTVYNSPHIGNLRTYLAADFFVRTLTLAGFKVKSVMNITDIDDKTLKGARELAVSLKEYTKKYEQIFVENLQDLNIENVKEYAHATDYFAKMRELVALLYKRGFAYEKDGSVYFPIDKLPQYGQLANIDKKGLLSGARVTADEYDKDNPSDFALWKKDDDFSAQKEGIEAGDFEGPEYEITSKGRPGWHIECSVMSRELLGQPFDIHFGGVDLIFPHHENEIAQSVAAYDKPLSKYWIHFEHLLVDGKKMSKSLHNFYTLDDIAQMGFSPMDFRLLAFSAHYRSRLDFSKDSLAQARENLARLREFAFKSSVSNAQGDREFFASRKEEFKQALLNDLNSPKALESIFNTMQKVNSENLFSKASLDYVSFIDQVLGLDLIRNSTNEDGLMYYGKIKENIKELVRSRRKAKSDGNYELADKLRAEIEDAGYELKDEKEGTRISKK